MANPAAVELLIKTAQVALKNLQAVAEVAPKTAPGVLKRRKPGIAAEAEQNNHAVCMTTHKAGSQKVAGFFFLYPLSFDKAYPTKPAPVPHRS